MKKALRSRIILTAALAVSSLACSADVELGDVMTLSGGAKEQKLYERIEHFNRARYWGSVQEAMSFIDGSHKARFLAQERERADSQRIVRTEISHVEINPDQNEAEIELEVQYIEQPTFLMKTRGEKQLWKFERYAGGWKLLDSDDLQDDQVEESSPNLSRGRMRGMGSY